MKKFHYYQKWFPSKIWRPKAHESEKAYAVRLIYYVICIQQVYEKITLTDFVNNFWYYIEKVEFPDKALFKDEPLATKEEKEKFLKKVSKWKNQYDWEKDYDEFQKNVRIASFEEVIGNFELQLPDKMHSLDKKAKRNDDRNRLLHNRPNAKDLDIERNVNAGSTILHDQLDIVEYATLKKEKLEGENTDSVVNNILIVDNPQWANDDLVFERDKELRDALFKKRRDAQ